MAVAQCNQLRIAEHASCEAEEYEDAERLAADIVVLTVRLQK